MGQRMSLWGPRRQLVGRLQLPPSLPLACALTYAAPASAPPPSDLAPASRLVRPPGIFAPLLQHLRRFLNRSQHVLRKPKRFAFHRSAAQSVSEPGCKVGIVVQRRRSIHAAQSSQAGSTGLPDESRSASR